VRGQRAGRPPRPPRQGACRARPPPPPKAARGGRGGAGRRAVGRAWRAAGLGGAAHGGLGTGARRGTAARRGEGAVPGEWRLRAEGGAGRGPFVRPGVPRHDARRGRVTRHDPWRVPLATCPATCPTRQFSSR
jgi:hypothetical protein